VRDLNFTRKGEVKRSAYLPRIPIVDVTLCRRRRGRWGVVIETTVQACRVSVVGELRSVIR
jgi:hypothetical protein